MQTAIALSLITMVLFGTANVLQKIPVNRIGAVKFISSRGLITSLITFFFACINFKTSVILDPITLLLGVLLAAVSYLGLYFFNMGLSKSKAGIVIPISFSRVIFTTLIGILFLGEIVKTARLFWMLPIIAGVILVSLDLKALKVKDEILRQGIIYSLLAAFFWGITIPLFGLFSNKLGLFTYAFIIEFTVLIISLIQTKISNRKQPLLPTKSELKQSWKVILLVSAAGAFASITMNAAYATGLITIVAAITSISPLVSILIGRLFLHEKMNAQQYFGAVVIIMGVIGISLS